MECKDAPRGQLPATASSEVVSNRIIDIDESGEDCRQTVKRFKMKIEVFNEVVSEMNPAKKAKK